MSPPRKRLPVVVLGCGRLGREVYLPILAARRDVRVHAACDADTSALEGAAAIVPKAKRVSAWHEALPAAPGAAVFIALPPARHADAAVAALQAGHHVYIEKPLAIALEEAERIVAAHRPGLTAAVGFNYRANALVDELRARVHAGVVGELRAVRSVFSTAMPPASWRAAQGIGGSVLWDLGSHHVDLVRYLTGREVVSVACEQVDAPGRYQCASLQLRLAGDVLVECLFAAGTIDDDRIEIVGTDGAVSIDRYASLLPRERGRAVPGRASGLRHAAASAMRASYLAAKRRAPWHEPSFAVAIGRFLDAAHTGAPCSPGIQDGWHCLAVIEAAERADRERRTIQLSPRA